MNTINISADATASRIGIGNQYENLATAVVFDCSKFAEDHGAGTAQVVHRRPTESIGYVCTNVSQEGNTVTWLVTDDDTSFTGKGLVQLRWYVDDVLRESVIFPTYILPSVTSSDDAPAEVKSALEQLMEYINDNTISIEDLDERIANYFYDHPLPMEGEADGLVAGSAKQLLSDSYTLDQVPYLFRKSPDSDRAVEEIVGGTVGWNQLQSNTVSRSTNGTTYTYSDGVLSIKTDVGGATASNWWLSNVNNKWDWYANHVYYVEIGNPNYTYSSGTIPHWYISFSSPININRSSQLIKPSVAVTQYLQFVVYSGNEIDATYKPQVFDLTTLFGSTIADYIYSLEQATAGAGVAKLKEWGFFNEDYYEYCEPTLKSVEGLVSKKTVGFNQWDEEWEVGGISSANGGTIAYTERIRSKNFVPILPDTQYCMRIGVSSAVILCVYDSNKEFIRALFQGRTVGTSGEVLTTPSTAKYLKFSASTTYGTTYNHDICINLSDPARNGQYEPYESHSYPLDSTLTLRGIPKLDSNNNLYFDGDFYPSDGQGERRYGLVDLGTLNWVYYEGSNYTMFIADSLGIALRTGWNGLCSAYPLIATAMASLQDKAISTGYGDGKLRIKDTSYTDAATFKTAMSGVMLLYELATPTTFTAQPYHTPQIVGDTEEFVTTGIVPVGHSTKYYENLRKKIENLPWNFSSLIAPTEVTNKATRNYTAGSYLILNNVLYKVTANIANGGTIIPNTNVTATTIMAEIMSL